MCMPECMLTCLSCVRLFAALWTASRQAPLSMGLPRQEHWNGLPCPPSGDLPDPGTEPVSPTSPAWQSGSSWPRHRTCVPYIPCTGSQDLPDPGTEPVSLTSPAWQSGSSWPRHWTWVPYIPCMAARHFTTTATWEAHIHVYSCQNTRDYVPKSVHLTMNFTLLKFKMVGDWLSAGAFWKFNNVAERFIESSNRFVPIWSTQCRQIGNYWEGLLPLYFICSFAFMSPPLHRDHSIIYPSFPIRWKAGSNYHKNLLFKKVGLKLNIQKTKIMASGPLTSWERDGETVETVSDFTFWAPKSLQMVIAAMKLKDAYFLEGKLWLTYTAY